MRADLIERLRARADIEAHGAAISSDDPISDVLEEAADALEASLQSGSAGEVDNVAARMWKVEAEESGTPASVAANRTREAFDSQSDELKARWRKFAKAALATPAKAAGGEPEDFGATALRTATEILTYLGFSTEPSQEPGFDRRRDTIARLIEAALPASPSPDGERQPEGDA